jgi:diphthine methyl ester acylhydrolase
MNQSPDSLRLWDRRKMGRPVLLHETDMGGGIWRIKWQPLSASGSGERGRGRLLALACMHAGAAVLRVGGGAAGVGGWGDGGVGLEAETVARHGKHRSMAYGIDWCQCPGAEEEEEERLLASCSFYDHALHLWRPL